MFFQLIATHPKLQIPIVKTKYLASLHFADIVNVSPKSNHSKTGGEVILNEQAVKAAVANPVVVTMETT